MRPPAEPRGPIFLHALRAVVAKPPLWIFCWSVPLLFAAVPALAWKSWFEATLEHRYPVGSLLASMDEVFRFDHQNDLDALKRGGGGVMAALAFAILFFSVYSAGGWLQVALERTSGHSLRRFMWGGARYFWRFVRVFGITVLTLALLSWVFMGWPWKALLALLFGAENGNLEVLQSESTAVALGFVQAAGYALGLALVLVWGDYTRARIALHNARSAAWAGLCTWGLLLWHPIRTLRPFLLIFLFEVAVVYGFGRLSWGVNTGLDEASSGRSIALLFALGQLPLLWQVICRGARYHAAVRISRTLVPPLSQPDPWASRVGGPGGPQYPIDDTDDYNVSL